MHMRMTLCIIVMSMTNYATIFIPQIAHTNLYIKASILYKNLYFHLYIYCYSTNHLNCLTGRLNCLNAK